MSHEGDLSLHLCECFGADQGVQQVQFFPTSSRRVSILRRGFRTDSRVERGMKREAVVEGRKVLLLYL